MKKIKNQIESKDSKQNLQWSSLKNILAKIISSNKFSALKKPLKNAFKTLIKSLHKHDLVFLLCKNSLIWIKDGWTV